MTTAAAFALALTAALPGKAPAQLDHGDIVVTTRVVAGSPIPEATVRAVIDAPPEKVWSVVQDCANYKTTMPNIAASVEVSREKPVAADGPDAAEVRTCRVVADLPFPFADLTSVTRGVHRIVPGKSWSRTWQLVSGDYVTNEGHWLVKPWGEDGKQSLVEYRIHAVPKVSLPDWLVSAIEEGKMPEMMKNLRKRVR